MKEHLSWALWIFTATYLFWGGAYFLQDLNFEFVIYVGVIVVIMGTLLLTAHRTELPHWLLWLLSIWGLLHILGGAVVTDDGVLFAYHIYPFLDAGGELYILKYDQVVHAYLYGLVAIAAYHVLRVNIGIQGKTLLVATIAILVSLGISSLNEIMEFLIAISLERNGVGGYENAMLDLIFNLGGAIGAILLHILLCRKTSQAEKLS